MTRHRTPPAPPRPVRTPTLLLIAAASVGSLAVVALIGTSVGHAQSPPVHAVTTTTAAVSPSVAAQAPWLPTYRPVSPVTVYRTAEVTWWRSRPYVAPPTRTAWATTTATTTATVTARATTTVTATATTTATVTATQTVTAQPIPTAP